MDIGNNCSDYTLCMDIMKADNIYRRILECYEKVETIKISVKEYKNSSISVVKLEEPIDGEDMSSSVRDIPEIEWKANNYKIFDKIHFHIRIHSDNLPKNEYLKNLHYLSLLILQHQGLIKERRLSIFLVPSTGESYPFTSSDNNIDISLYKEASVRLRTLIQQGNNGLIYGVAQSITDTNRNIVKALDFKAMTKKFDCFPVIVLRDNNNDDSSVCEKYINGSKVTNKGTFEKSEISKLNHYNLLFGNKIAGTYIE